MQYVGYVWEILQCKTSQNCQENFYNLGNSSFPWERNSFKTPGCSTQPCRNVRKLLYLQTTINSSLFFVAFCVATMWNHRYELNLLGVNSYD